MVRTTYLHDNWEFTSPRWLDRDRPVIRESNPGWLLANVPGHVHVDLFENGVIGHPFERINELGVQWVDREDWTYRTTFEWQADEAFPKRVLQFDGLDTVCEVFLNGASIAKSDNMFIPLGVDVSSLLVAGTNELVIKFESAVRVGEERQSAFWEREGLPQSVARFTDRAFVRKAQYMFGWDWGPRLVSAGVWKPVSLVEYASRISDVHVTQTHESNGSVRLSIVTTVEGAGSPSHHVMTPDGDIVATMESDGEVIIDQPELWWPQGMGDPALYSVVTLLSDGSDLRDMRTTRVGLRTIELRREKDQWGESFEFLVNGHRLYVRGANWIPDHSFPGTISRAQLRTQIERSLDLEMNMLRVWGGGLYESDDFYEICDEAGMMVWQDFPYACGYYPDDAEAQAIAHREASVNVVRLRNHACLALWCGNNENQQMWDQKWGGAEFAPPRYYGENIYLDTLPKVLAEFDAGRPYIPSSADSASDAVKGTHAVGDANAGGSGDSHYWDVWHGRGDWKFYADSTARFSSEFGFASPASMDIWHEYADDEDKEVFSPVVKWHDKTMKGYDTFVNYTKLHYPSPVTLEDWVYYGQLNQRDALRFGIEHFRREPFCRGTLIWQINDCWPVQSWAVIDSNGNYKAAAYEMRRIYADALLSIVRDGESVKVVAVNDSPDEDLDASSVILMAVSTLTGELVAEWDAMDLADPEIGPAGRKCVITANIAGLNVAETVLVATWPHGQAWQLLGEPKDSRFADAGPITISTASDGILQFRTTTPVIDLRFTDNGSTVPFLDNYVTALSPGVHEIRLTALPDNIEARSLSGVHELKITRSPL